MDDLNRRRKEQAPIFHELKENERPEIQAKNADRRYLSAADMVRDLSNGLNALARPSSLWAAYAIPAMSVILLAAGVSVWFDQRSEKRHWARERAIPEIARLAREHRPVAAFLLAQKAQKYLPGDPELVHMVEDITGVTSVRSTPLGASVEIKDYLFPDDPWSALGTTPLDNIRIPSGYLRWRVSKAGLGEYSGAPIDFEIRGGTLFFLGAADEHEGAAVKTRHDR